MQRFYKILNNIRDNHETAVDGEKGKWKVFADFVGVERVIAVEQWKVLQFLSLQQILEVLNAGQYWH